MNNNNEKNSMPIDWVEIARIIWGHILIILAAAVVCSGIGYAYGALTATPAYRSSALMIVNEKDNTTTNVSNTYNSQYSSATKLVKVYSVIIKSDTVLKRVIEELGLSISYSSLYNCITVASVDDTPVMKITATLWDPVTAHDVVAKITEIAPDIIVDTVQAGSVKIISEAALSNANVGPAKSRYVLLGVILGALISAIVFVAIELLNKRIRSAADIEKYLGLPVLGVIPAYKKKEEQ